MKKRFSFAVLGLIAVLIVSFVIAQESTLIADETAIPNSENCFDRDSGVYAKVPGGVVAGRFFVRSRFDVCAGSEGRNGRTQIKEYYCGSTGNAEEQIMGVEQLGDGYCTYENVDVEGRTRRVAKWISLEPSCEVRPFGAVDQRGEIFRTGCYLNDRVTREGGRVSTERPFVYKRYSCNEEGTAVAENEENCLEIGASLCNPRGCSGVCTDSDAENNIDVAGSVTSDGNTYEDVCAGDNNVRQYQCSVNGRAQGLDARSCGANRRCREGRCENIFVEAEDQQDVNDRTSVTINELNEKINDLYERIAELEGRLSSLESESSEVALSPRRW